MRQMRGKAGPRPVEDEGLPLEAIYADDTDFFSMSLSYLKRLENIIPPTIGLFNLMANASKWERTALMPISDTGEGQEWRTTKKLGSLLGDEEDIGRRKVLATAAFKSLRLLWERRKVTSLSTRMHAYKALVLPVLLYNCGTWGVTEAVMGKLEVFHRRQLREILGVRTRGISRKELYKRCQTEPLYRQVVEARWNLFGHILRLDEATPAQLAMDYYCQSKVGDVSLKGSRGRPDTSLPVLLFNDYRKYIEDKKGKQIQGASMKLNARFLKELRELADKSNRGKWQEFKAFVCRIPAQFVFDK